MDTKICSQCYRELPLSEFYSRGNGKLRAECKDCHKNMVKESYQRRKQFVSNYKSEQGCSKCGDKRSYVLDFHHRDPEEKNDTIARLTSNSSKLTKIKEEMEKCEVLCANCHREFHHFEECYGLTLEEYLLDIEKLTSLV